MMTLFHGDAVACPRLKGCDFAHFTADRLAVVKRREVEVQHPTKRTGEWAGGWEMRRMDATR